MRVGRRNAQRLGRAEVSLRASGLERNIREQAGNDVCALGARFARVRAERGCAPALDDGVLACDHADCEALLVSVRELVRAVAVWRTLPDDVEDGGVIVQPSPADWHGALDAVGRVLAWGGREAERHGPDAASAKARALLQRASVESPAPAAALRADAPVRVLLLECASALLLARRSRWLARRAFPGTARRSARKGRLP